MKIYKYLNDFVASAQTENGYGKFYRNIHAIVLANSMSKMQIKKYKNIRSSLRLFSFGFVNLAM